MNTLNDESAELILLREVHSSPTNYLSRKVRIVGSLCFYDPISNCGILSYGSAKILFDMKYEVFEIFSIDSLYKIVGTVCPVNNVILLNN